MKEITAEGFFAYEDTLAPLDDGAHPEHPNVEDIRDYILENFTGVFNCDQIYMADDLLPDDLTLYSALDSMVKQGEIEVLESGDNHAQMIYKVVGETYKPTFGPAVLPKPGKEWYRGATYCRPNDAPIPQKAIFELGEWFEKKEKEKAGKL